MKIPFGVIVSEIHPVVVVLIARLNKISVSGIVVRLSAAKRTNEEPSAKAF